MQAAILRVIAVVIAYVTLPGCLQNSVHQITATRQPHPDSAHSIVVVGVGLDAAWPFAAFSLALDEYSLEKHEITGNCFRYNHIEATRPSIPAKVSYFAYQVPAGAYVYSPFNAHARLSPSVPTTGFIAPPGRAVYFGDYVFVGNQTVELRSDIAAARQGVKSLIPAASTLEQAAPARIGYARPFLCTP